MQYDNYTTAATEVKQLAITEAGRFKHRFAGVEHLLLACIAADHQSCTLLRRMGISPIELRGELNRVCEEGSAVTVGDINWTPLALDVINTDAWEEVKATGSSLVDEVHIFLAILRRREMLHSVAPMHFGAVLDRFGIKLNSARLRSAEVFQDIVFPGLPRELISLTYQLGLSIDTSSFPSALRTAMRDCELVAKLRHAMSNVTE